MLADIASVIYILFFAVSGWFLARLLLPHDRFIRRLLFGLTAGLVMLMWLPVLLAFILGFTAAAQYAALAIAVGIGVLSIVLYNKMRRRSGTLNAGKAEGFSFKRERGLIFTCLPLIIIGVVLLSSHTITSASNGSLHVGQCTYGDLCMHLGFISSIATQKTFPPTYSILPGTPLGYPFLCDSVSSTFYSIGASLRFSALLPAVYAYIVVVLGVYLFFEEWFRRSSVASIATWLFYIGGGLGFFYFFDNAQTYSRLVSGDQWSSWLSDTYHISAPVIYGANEGGLDMGRVLMDNFYNTPTNFVSLGLRWVNSIADMLVPQRATLFGWALLFPALQLLHRAAFNGERRLFVYLGVLAGAMPLVHTHSFLALGMISVPLFIAACLRLLKERRPGGDARFAARIAACFTVMLAFGVLKLLPIPLRDASDGPIDVKICTVGVIAAACAAMIFAFAEMAKGAGSKSGIEDGESRAGRGVPLVAMGAALALGGVCLLGVTKSSVLAALAPLAGLVLCICFALTRKGRQSSSEGGKASADLRWFALFGVIAVLLAAPQLFGFTFRQSSAGGFLQWHWNWCNESDSWLWFYIKNLGFIFILMPVAFLNTKRENRLFYSGGLLIWAICEFVIFQPNTYDNNKLLFVWFALTCGIVAELMISMLDRLNLRREGGSSLPEPSEAVRLPVSKRAANYVLLAVMLAAMLASGVMTIAREYVSADHLGLEDGELKSIESGYEVVSSELVELCEFVKENTEPDAVFLTHNNHNNAIAMLTGRSIVCGSGTFLHFHGVDYQAREQSLRLMYEEPYEYFARYAEEYGVDYVLIGQWEMRSYNIDYGYFGSMPLVYDNEEVRLYKVGG